MTQEEKAKAYDKALEKVRQIHNEDKAQCFDVMAKVFPELAESMAKVFPELAESKEEKIQKWLINLVKNHIKGLEDKIKEQLSNGQVYSGELNKAQASLAWLEKQEDKPLTLQDLSPFKTQVKYLLEAGCSGADPIYLNEAAVNKTKQELSLIPKTRKEGEQKSVDSPQDLSAFKAQLKEYLLEEGWSEADPIYLDEAVDYKTESLLALIPNHAKGSDKEEKPLKIVGEGDIVAFYEEWKGEKKRGLMLVKNYDYGASAPRCIWGLHCTGTWYGDWAPSTHEFFEATEEEKQLLIEKMPDNVRARAIELNLIPKTRKKGEQQLTNHRACQCNADGILAETEGIRRISKERNRQIEEEGYDEEHDAQEPINRMVACAISYAMHDIDEQEADAWWSWDRQYFKPKDRIRNLERAGALIAAAIDKIVKEESESNPSQEQETFPVNL